MVCLVVFPLLVPIDAVAAVHFARAAATARQRVLKVAGRVGTLAAYFLLVDRGFLQTSRGHGFR